MRTQTQPVSNPTDLDARYGRTPTRARRNRILAWGTGIAVAAVFTAWVVWVGMDQGGQLFSSRDVGHKIVDSRTVDVRWEMTMEPGLAAQCALQAQNEAHSIVGWKIVDIPASDRYTRTFSETVRTTETPVTGLLYRCWLI